MRLEHLHHVEHFIVGASDLRHFAINVLQHLVYGFKLGDGVLVVLSLSMKSFNCIRSGTEFGMDEIALN
jgi:hypothetical protein